MSHNKYRFMKFFTLFVIAFCSYAAVTDIASGQYGWAVIQLILVALNIHSYRKY